MFGTHNSATETLVASHEFNSPCLGGTGAVIVCGELYGRHWELCGLVGSRCGRTNLLHWRGVRCRPEGLSEVCFTLTVGSHSQIGSM